MPENQNEQAGGIARPLTYGEKAVGLTFNPSNSSEVNEIKAHYARIIDMMHDRRNEAGTSEQARLLSIAITEAQTAQMWAVKAVTYRD